MKEINEWREYMSGLREGYKVTHNADSIIESKAIYYLKYCRVRV
jgi:hypothetical protein